MQVIGLCRFSYPAIGGFQIQHDNVATREAFLYATERLQPKFASFETITLPSIRAQTDPDFTFVIVIGEGLPDIHKARLLDLIDDIPQAVLVTMAPGQHRPVMRKVLNTARAPDSDCLQFRLDDDDAIACDFIELARQAASDAKPLIAKHGPLAIDFNHGHLIQASAKGITAQPVAKPFLTAALGAVFPAHDIRTIMGYGHHKLPTEMMSLSFTRSDMFLRGIGTHNDSSARFKFDLSDFKPLTAEQANMFEQRFGLSIKHVQATYGKLIPQT